LDENNNIRPFAEWSEIARQLPGRTDNAIKNYWNSAAGKKMREKIRKKAPPDCLCAFLSSLSVSCYDASFVPG
jgi:hypothetical protein